jgi:hypothetical protein
LAADLGIKKIAIGLDPKTLLLPLDPKRFGKPKNVSFVVPDLGDDKRESHAKWLEIDMAEGVLTMTGSVNATEQSFASTKNVEVSLIRVLRKGAAKWRMAKPRQIKYVPFPSFKRSAALSVVNATLLADGQLIGTVESSLAMPERVTVVLLHRGEPVYEATAVELGKSGSFWCKVETKWTESDGSLQVRVLGDGLVALGWINNELQLEASEAQRQNMAAVNRIFADAYTADDVYQLFALLLEFTNSPIASVSSGRRPTGTSPDTPGATPFSLSLWELSGHQHMRVGLLGQSAARGLDAMYEWLSLTSTENTRVQEHGREDAVGYGSSQRIPEKARQVMLSDENREAGEPSSGESKAERNSRLIRKLLEAIPERLTNNPSHPGAPELARIVAAFAVRNALSAKAGEWADTQKPQPCLNWLDTFSRIGFARDAIKSLTPHIVAMGCLATALSRGLPSIVQVAAQVKETFRRFGVAVNDQQTLGELCRDGAQHRAFELVPKEIREKLDGELPTILAAETGEDAVLKLLGRLARGEFVGATNHERELLGSDVASALLAYARAADRRCGVVQDLNDRGCPCCYIALPAATIQRLRQTHAAVCSNMLCGRALFWVRSAHLSEVE